MNTHRIMRPLSVAALALAFTLPTYAATAKSSVTAGLAQAMAANEQAAKPTADQLAAQYPALALMPPSVADFVCISDIAGVAKTIHAAQGSPGTLAPVFSAIDSAALGSDGANATLIPAFINFIERSIQPHTHVDDEGNVLTTYDNDGALTELLTKAPSLDPIYAVLTCKDGQEQLFSDWNSQIAEAPFLSPMDDAPEGYVGGKVNWDSVLERSAYSPEAQAAMKKRTLHIFSKVQGQALIIVVCEKPSMVPAPPATPAASLLGKAGKNLQPAPAKGQTPAVALNLSAASAKTISRSGTDSVGELEKQTKDNPLAATAKELADICKTCSKLPLTKPLTLQLWHDDKGLSVTASLDAQGASYKPGKLRLSSMGDAASTIFYAESTPFQLPKELPGMPHLVKVFGDTLLPAMAFASAMESDELLATIQGTTSAIETMLTGLEGNAAIIVDNKGTTPAAFGGDGKTPFARLGIYAGVEDRPKLSEGWDALIANLKRAGMDPDKDMPIETRSSGKVTRHSLNIPLFTKDFMPNVILTDKHLALGTAPALNVQMLRAAGKAKSGTVKGGMFVLRMKPLMKCLPETAPTPEPARKVVAREIDTTETDADDTMDDYEEEMLENEKISSPAETAAQALTTTAQVLDSIRGTTTIENGTY